jgi:CheY-like chemotaxis protein
MQLDYKVLFVDDDGFDDYMDELRDVIKAHLKDKGFVLQAIEVKTEEKLESQILTDKNYDMIFVDNRFDDKECGIDFIKRIRDSNIYSDIVLCTAQSDSELIKKINADTVAHGYYYIRKGQNLFQHIYNVIDFRFNKELDTNVMRGIAMSEVAKFDAEILKIILKNDKYKTQILDTIKSKIEKRYKESISTTSNDKIWKCVSDPEKSTIYFESTMRKDFLYTNVINDIDLLKECYNAIKDIYGDSILKKRNDLAHKIELNLSNDDKKKLRQDLIKFREIFDEIKKYFGD